MLNKYYYIYFYLKAFFSIQIVIKIYHRATSPSPETRSPPAENELNCTEKCPKISDITNTSRPP